jgi:hypothetical protein
MGSLLQSFDKTKLDLENANPSGFQTLDTITTYPASSTGTPTPSANPGAPTYFRQSYVPSNTYLETIRTGGSKFLNIESDESSVKDIFDATNLDTSKPGVDGGIPYKQIKDPTVYPVTTQGRTPISGYNATSGQDATKFDQKFSTTNTYLDYIK